MNLYLVRGTGWGMTLNLVEATSVEEAIGLAYPNGTGLYRPEVEYIELKGTLGVRWSHEDDPDSERGVD